ncbi:Phosphotransferase system, enzyme I N-terminal [Acididesulfobacillus acetoxydans]|uniref:Phosphoenolpyruvate-protein phosphotransferase n=1 Tax=Acididesulfobacillus acetoxydans TaxID=1561005 RepID=A0A8S0VWI3_9FIRM|nr:Phosphotransferase system, enzyme I N-terminal [Acididesulfobacillus acetoxydans]CEJ08940.1 Phosphoenolpyruvate-protein phosphotransferase [Acididesulfobacillus acetoxydans]
MQGIGVSPGIAIGEALVLRDALSALPERSRLAVEEENERLNRSLSSARRQLEKIRADAETRLGDKAEILDAQILITEDEELLSLVCEKLKEGLTAEAALRDGVEYYANLMENMDNEYLRERAADIRDTGRRVIRDLMGVEETDLAHLSAPCIVVASDLTPSDTATMAPERVLGFITDVGGRTSHSAIMARTLEIPAIVGTVRGTELIRTGDSLILDGDSGEVIVNPEPEVLGAYREKQRA